MSAVPSCPPEPWLMIGEHPLVCQLRMFISRAARMRTPVVVEGPTGAGKELVVRQLHRESGRPGQLVCMNCAAVPEALAEGELFGAAKGAYTGSLHTRPGHLQEARNGTLFLDEAGDLPLPVQAKLLRSLETGEVNRLGSLISERVDFRLVVAVQDSPDVLVRERRWRPDFRYRVTGIRLRVPALSERRSDLPLLAGHFLEYAGLAIDDPGAMAPLQEYEWPGNVRQLRQVIERAGFLASPGAVTRHAIAESLAIEQGFADSERHESVRLDAAALRLLLERHDGRAKRAAVSLGVSRSTMYRWLREAGLGCNG